MSDLELEPIAVKLMARTMCPSTQKTRLCRCVFIEYIFAFHPTSWSKYLRCDAHTKYGEIHVGLV